MKRIHRWNGVGRKIRRAGAWLVLSALTVSLLNNGNVGVTVRGETEASYSQTRSAADIDTAKTPLEYDTYAAQYASVSTALQTVTVDAAAFSADDGAEIRREELDSVPALLWENETGSISCTVTVPETALYSLSICYYPLPGKGKDIQIGFQLDGAFPFTQSDHMTFSRIWKDAAEITTDNRGNEIRPEQTEAPRWNTQRFRNDDSLYETDFVFFLTAGEHTLTLLSEQEPFALASLTLSPPEQAKPYQAPETVTNNSYLQRYEAEDTLEKSHSVLYPMNDRGSAATVPCDPSLVRLNTIGRSNWKYQGQWISWAFDVPEDGYYCFAFRAKQNFLRGMPSTRTLLIDGELPCAEAAHMEFPYKVNWYIQSFGDGNTPYALYLEKGQHTLTLCVNLGEITTTLRHVESVIASLNTMYRKIIMITSTTPDIYRDYKLNKEISDLIPTFKENADRLREEIARIEKIIGGSGSEASMLEEVAAQLDSFIKDPYTIPERLSRYKENINSLGSWLLQIKEQALELDSFFIYSPDQPLPNASASFGEQLSFDIRAFFDSFFNDYNSIGSTYSGDSTLTVWAISAGRDQLQIVKSLMDDRFTPAYNIGVNLSLVTDSATLTQAILGGRGPDLAMMVPQDVPVNLAFRGALTDLSTMEGFSDLTDRWYPSALKPYEYENGVYALPETQSFLMMFVRTDIFAELGISIPTTWDEFYRVVPYIQKKNLTVGVPSTQILFESLLFQNGGDLYLPDRTASGLNEKQAQVAFEMWTGFYTEYGFPVDFDLYNRFRTGEIPLGIAAVSFYNQLSEAAPEISGLWTMVPLPGTVDENGELHRQSSSTGMGCCIMAGSAKQKEAFQFLDWWTGTETQGTYGVELENVMGPLARYETANVQAFDELPWSSAEAGVIKEQWDAVEAVWQLPGNYYVSRNITFAFRSVVNNLNIPREVLKKYAREIDAEILRKRREFGLET